MAWDLAPSVNTQCRQHVFLSLTREAKRVQGESLGYKTACPQSLPLDPSKDISTLRRIGRLSEQDCAKQYQLKKASSFGKIDAVSIKRMLVWTCLNFVRCDSSDSLNSCKRHELQTISFVYHLYHLTLMDQTQMIIIGTFRIILLKQNNHLRSWLVSLLFAESLPACRASCLITMDRQPCHSYHKH